MAKKEKELVIHNIKIARAVERLKESNISKRNKEDILAFKDDGLRNGYSDHRAIKYVQVLPVMAEKLNKDFRDCEREDYEKVVDWIAQNKQFEGWTKQTYSAVLKKFVWWLENQKIREENIKVKEYNKAHPSKKKPEEDEYLPGDYPKKIKWLKTTFFKNKKDGYKGTELPKELISEEDAIKLTEGAQNPRDKAIIAILYEAGPRAGELLGLRIRDVELPNKSGGSSHLVLKGKTGERTIWVYWCVPYIREWLNKHPFRDNASAPLWLSLGGHNRTLTEEKNLSYPYLNKLLREAAIRAKIKKPVNPHIFRHSSATRNAKVMSQAQLNDYYGWSMSSTMAAVYLHRAGLNTEGALKKAYGLEKQEEEFANSKLKPQICVNCKEENTPEAKYCNKCGTPLSVAQALDRDEKVKLAGELIYRLTTQGGKPGEIKAALEELLEKNPKSSK